MADRLFDFSERDAGVWMNIWLYKLHVSRMSQRYKNCMLSYLKGKSHATTFVYYYYYYCRLNAEWKVMPLYIPNKKLMYVKTNIWD